MLIVVDEVSEVEVLRIDSLVVSNVSNLWHLVFSGVFEVSK